MLQSKVRTAFKAVGVILIFCIVGVGILFLDRILTPSAGKADTFEQARRNLMAAEFDGEMYMRKNIVTYMIAGIDKRPEEVLSQDNRNDSCADFVMLVIVDKSNQEISAVNVNRDTMVVMDMLGYEGWVTKTEDDKQPLTLAHTWGNGGQESADNLRRAVSRLFLNVSIDHYVTLQMEAVGALNDYINAHAKTEDQKVSVTFPQDADMNGLEKWEAGSTVVIEGSDALKLVRTRDTDLDGSNALRMERQRLYVEALAKAIGSNKWDRGYMLGALEAIDGAIYADHTNIDSLQYELQELFDAFGFYSRNAVINLNEENGFGHYGKFERNSGVTNDAFYIETPEEKAALQNLVIKEFYRKIEKDD